MIKYFSTFITGLQDIVVKALEQELPDVDVELTLDGLVVYSTNNSVSKIKCIRFLNNSFLLQYQGDRKLSPQELIKYILNNSRELSDIPKNELAKHNSFRVIASDENQLVSVDKQLLTQVENLFQQKLGLEVNRSLPDIEVWFITRRENYSFVGLRISKTPNYEKTLHKGELRPELANIICLLGDLDSTDVVLDPFAGYGAIPFECAKYFSVKKIIAGENNKAVFKVLQQKALNIKPKVIVGKWNALKLTSLTDGSVDKIITDPPWGIFDENILDIKSFYRKMITEFNRVIRPNGVVVILTAKKDEMEELIDQSTDFTLKEKFDVLVSGKKSAIYKLVKD